MKSLGALLAIANLFAAGFSVGDGHFAYAGMNLGFAIWLFIDYAKESR